LVKNDSPYRQKNIQKTAYNRLETTQVPILNRQPNLNQKSGANNQKMIETFRVLIACISKPTGDFRPAYWHSRYPQLMARADIYGITHLHEFSQNKKGMGAA
jgi:hypothetical protein